MATTYTPNYNLGKQTDPNDNFDMSVITANMDTIDAQMKTNADNIALAQQNIDDLSPVLTQILNTVGGIEQTTNTINTNVTDIKNGIGDTAEILELILSGYMGASNKVNFYDYDGSVLYSYTKDEFLALTEMPANPSHEGLTAQGWNWSLVDAKTYVTANGSLNIGQMYVTSDGKTRLYITLTEGRISPILQLYLNANTTLDIDWGDGSTHSTFTRTTANYVSERHNYVTAGNYAIAISVTTGGFALQSSSTNVSSILWNGNNNTYSPDKAYSNSIKKIEIGTGGSIGSNAFNYCTSLQSITIPNGVTSIGQQAFNNCYSLTSITIPNKVTSISQYAFYYCYSLQSIIIGSGVTNIGNNVFQNCSSLQSITIPNGVTSIGSQVFQSCFSLTSVIIPNGVTSIGIGAFSTCYSLTSFTIPDSVTSIGSNAFNGCNTLTSITIPDTITSIGNNAFQNCYALSSITIPDTVTSIGNNAFYQCYSLTSVIIPNGVTSIGSNAFQSCISLSSATIPNTVTSIGQQAFQYCYALSSVIIGKSVTTIGSSAFYNCTYMESIKFTSTTPPTVSSSNAWSGVPTSCIIYVPSGTLETYKAATNYPNPSTYTYIEY